MCGGLGEAALLDADDGRVRMVGRARRARRSRGIGGARRRSGVRARRGTTDGGGGQKFLGLMRRTPLHNQAGFGIIRLTMIARTLHKKLPKEDDAVNGTLIKCGNEFADLQTSDMSQQDLSRGKISRSHFIEGTLEHVSDISCLTDCFRNCATIVEYKPLRES